METRSLQYSRHGIRPRKLGLRLSLIVLFFVVANPLDAQVILGVHAGPSIATQALGSVSTRESRSDWLRRVSFGASLGIPITGPVAIQVGGFLAQKGSRQSEDGVTGTLLFDYLEIPVLLTFRTGVGGVLRARLFAGPAFSFETGCDVDYHIDRRRLTTTCENLGALGSLARKTEGTDLGIVAGVGLDMTALRFVWLTLDAAYNHGLRVIDPADKANPRNRAVTVHAGLAIPIG